MHYMGRHTLLWVSTIWVSAVVAAGCSADNHDIPDPQATTTAEAGGEVAPQASAEPAAAITDTSALAQHIAFTPCATDPELECGQLSVPVDYADVHGERIALATVRARALTRNRKGILFVNPGGPGGSGVDLVIQGKALFTALRQNFDIVSFDPRGTGRSQSVDCTIDVPPPPSDGSVAAAAVFLDELGARYARACSEQHGALVTQVGTNNVARDMDVFRASLGEHELNYLGFSYGTILGASYATLFPHRVRAMVLDGNVDPAWFTDYLLELDADGSAGAELALRRLDQLCRAAVDCPLRDAGVIAVYDRVVDRLNRNPVVVGQNIITGASVAPVVLSLLFQELRGWPLIVNILARADAGDVTALVAFPIDPSPTLTVPNAAAIVCDDSTTRRLGLDYLPAQTANDMIFPRLGGTNFGFAITTCSAWPASHSLPVANLATRNPIVLLGNDFDPATPMAWSRNMSAALGPKAAFVRYQGGGHTVFAEGSACIDNAVESYIRDLIVPAKGLTCPAQPLSFATAAVGQRASTPTMAEILQQVNPAPPALRHK